jgi:hypothetical protein
MDLFTDTAQDEAARLRSEARKLYKQYRQMFNGPEREKLWRKERDLILKAQALEAHIT